VESGIPVHEEPKFLVFYTMLLNLFTVFCFHCKMGKPKVVMKKNGTMVTVVQTCNNCSNGPFIWRSQPYVLGRYPAGNILFSFAVLMAGASISKVLLVCKHMGMSVYSIRTYFIHQKKIHLSCHPAPLGVLQSKPDRAVEKGKRCFMEW